MTTPYSRRVSRERLSAPAPVAKPIKLRVAPETRELFEKTLEAMATVTGRSCSHSVAFSRALRLLALNLSEATDSIRAGALCYRVGTIRAGRELNDAEAAGVADALKAELRR